jgi:hypothetical protein
LKLFYNIYKKFICDSELRDEKFDKYDDDYMPDKEDDNVGQEVVEPFEDDISESIIYVFIRSICIQTDIYYRIYSDSYFNQTTF